MAGASKRVYELAKDYKISSNAMLKILHDMDFEAKSHMSVATPEMIDAVVKKFAAEKQEARREMKQRARPAGVPRIRTTARPKPKPQESTTQPETKAQAPAQDTAADKSAPAEPDRRQPARPRGRATGTETRPEPARRQRPPQAGKDTPAAAGTGPGDGAAGSTTTNVGGLRVSTSSQKVAEVARKAEKKKKKKDRRRKKGRREVDQNEVARSFRATMATMTGGKSRRRTRRSGADADADGQDDGNVLEVNEYMSVAELANIMDVKPAQVVAKLLELGMMATINQRLDLDTIQMIASEFGFETQEMAEVGEEAREQESEAALVERAPVVTVMGHVDHGKTSLLDYIRKTNVVAGEAGAITQHIGAYQVVHEDKRIVFLDTPGHEAFTAMRARGAHLTDIVILVVAADEAVMPQTVEAIDHARAAGVPIIVAINKIDKPGANPDNVRTQLAQHNLLDEDWGGKTITVLVSAKKGEGIDKLLEMVLLQSELLDLKADPTIRAQGVIVDARLEKGRGTVITALIQRGICKVGDSIVAGTHFGHVRTMNDDRDKKVDTAGPSTPVQITGLSGVPQAGDSFLVVSGDQEAREITMRRSQVKREYEFRRPHGPVTLDRVFDRIKEGQIKELRLVIKGDVDGSVEVLSDQLGKIATNEVKTHILRRSVGSVTESDVLLAAASDAIIIGFQVGIDIRARELSRTEKVDIRVYDVIYEAENDVRKALEGLLSPTYEDRFVGQAEVRDVFKIPRIGLIAGCYVREGRITRQDKVRLMRDGKLVYSGNVSSLKRFKDDVREVKEGFECGIGIENYNDVKVGDVIEAYEVVEQARTLS